jgi:hypothetical protein
MGQAANLKPTAELQVAAGVSKELVHQQEASARPELASRPRRRADGWFVWLLALASLAVPVIILVCVDSIPKGALVWHAVNVSIGRGDFLIPAMALCVESIRRWWRDVDAANWRGARLLATFVCATSGLVCVIAMTTAATLPVTPQTGNSVAVITSATLVVGVAFGSLAVGATRSVVVT